MKKIYILAFLFVLVLGFILRFYDLGKTPDSLNWDEVSWGYNAYSILKTGHDEYGTFMPLSFKAFGDYKQPVYVYLTSLSEGLFGLSAFAVRFPSAALGFLTIPFVWLLVSELFHKNKHRYLLSLASMFFFAISPWSIQFSRVAYEANIGLFFVICGVGFFLRGLNLKNNWYCYLSIILLSISGYSYHSEKIFTPLIFLGLLIYAYLSYHLTKKILLIFFLLFILGNLLWLVDARTTARGRSVTFLSNQTQILQNSTAEIIYDKSHNDLFDTFFHNRRIVYINKYIENYLSHFDLNELFVTGDNARHHTFGMGILCLFSLPLILLGVYFIEKRRYWFVFLWFFLAPAASALAVDAPNASRALIFLPTWQIFEALGLVYLIGNRKKTVSKIFLSVIAILLFGNFVYFAHNYFFHTNSEYGVYWQDGYEDAVNAISQYKDTSVKVFFSDKYEQPYVFYLFYTKYDPGAYNGSGGSERTKNSCYPIDNIYFGKCKNYLVKGDIYVSPAPVEDSSLKKISEIVDKKGEVVGVLYQAI